MSGSVPLDERPLTLTQRAALKMLCRKPHSSRFVSLYTIAAETGQATRTVGIAMHGMHKRGLVKMSEVKERPAGSRQSLLVRYFKVTRKGLKKVGGIKAGPECIKKHDG